MWILPALLSAVAAAFVSIFAKLGLKGIDTTLATTVRAIIMALSLLIFSLATGKFSLKAVSQIPASDMRLIFFSGLAGATSWLLYFFALKFGLASKVSAIDRTSLLFVILFSVLFLGESASWKTFAGAVLIISGTLLITFK